MCQVWVVGQLAREIAYWRRNEQFEDKSHQMAQAGGGKMGINTASIICHEDCRK